MAKTIAKKTKGEEERMEKQKSNQKRKKRYGNRSGGGDKDRKCKLTFKDENSILVPEREKFVVSEGI